LKVENCHLFHEPKINILKLVPMKCCSLSKIESSSSMKLLFGCGRLDVRSLTVHSYYQFGPDNKHGIDSKYAQSVAVQVPTGPQILLVQ